MSEEIDLNTNNLCTTEDAFEKFQAVSMYEENEFVMLSDIVSPQPETSHLASVLNDIPYENEVVLESHLEEQVFEVNSTIESGSEEIKPVEVESQLKESSLESSHKTLTESPTPKRGRKKKYQHIDLIPPICTTPSQQSNGTQNSSISDSQPSISPPIQKRRGRKPKKKIDNTSDDSMKTSNDSLDCNNAVAISSKNNRRKASLKTSPQVNTYLLNDSAVEKRSGTRKGRKGIQSILDGTTDKNISDMTDSSNINISNEKIPKRGRPRKYKSLDVDLKNKMEDTEVIQSENELQHDRNNVHDDTIESNIDNKSNSIRSRSNESLTEEIPVTIEETLKVSNEEDDDDAADDICLSKLKDCLEPKDSNENADNIAVESKTSETVPIKEEDSNNDFAIKNDTPEQETAKSNSIKPDVMTDFEDKIDTIVNVSNCENKETVIDDINQTEKLEESLLVEDTSKRPVRRKAKQTMHYEEESDEDPYANMESSEDEEPKRGKKSTKYYSDDEYVPGSLKRGNESSSDISDIDDEIDELIKQRRKKKRVDSSLDKSPKKRGRKSKQNSETIKIRSSPEVQTIEPIAGPEQDDDVEVCLQSSVIKTNEDSNQKLGWGAASSEIKNFIAKKIQGTDIKITKATSVQPIEIPVIDPKLAKKTVETGAQTTSIKTNSIEVQTSAPYDVPMKDNVTLTAEQTEKACEFLKGIVKTTAELGQLMTQKSEDFIDKKINSTHVTDTFKMDYCVRKSFLLFKLAKHNLIQMEEDLAKQYDEFLSSNNLLQYREKPKVVLGTPKTQESDSDCEIIEEPVVLKTKTEKVKPKFNPKTVFLNKELSIKIAKKPSKEKKLNIKNPHTVWINDSVMVKKVKPTQSFLAQDSRNKKPPDFVSVEMVNNFFKEYYCQQALLICKPFVSMEWFSHNKQYQCSYFFTKTDGFSTRSVSSEIPSSSGLLSETVTIKSNEKNNSQHSSSKHTNSSPKTLFSLCIEILQNHLCLNRAYKNTSTSNDKINGYACHPQTLHCLCVNNINLNINKKSKPPSVDKTNHYPLPLKTLCLKEINNLIWFTHAHPHIDINHDSVIEFEHINHYKDFTRNSVHFSESECIKTTVDSLFSLCVRFIQSKLSSTQMENSIIDKHIPDINSCFTPKTLKDITFKNVMDLIYDDKNNIIQRTTNSIAEKRKMKTLSAMCFKIITNFYAYDEVQASKECLTINSVNTLTEEAYLSIERSNELTENLEYYAGDESNNYEDETDNFADYEDVSHIEEDNWISQVQMKELRSCFVPNVTKKTTDLNVIDNEFALEQESVATKIKLEPEEEPNNIIDTSVVKTEPINNLDEMTIIPESIIPKAEEIDHNVLGDQTLRSSAYDVETFEAFVMSNKMMHALNERTNSEDLFSQSVSRIRRQYEPDSDTEFDMSMSLLVPQTYEPMHIENAKDSLMESSGDEKNCSKKAAGRKKQDKRKAKPKKTEPKTDKQATTEKTASKEIGKEKSQITNEVTLLTRRMREKIRQEEKKVISSDSESEDIPLGVIKDKDILPSKKANENNKDSKKTKLKNSHHNDDAIQCNNVDSTEQLNETSPKKCISPDPSNEKFTGFSGVDQSDISNYQKYLKYLTDKETLPISGDKKLGTKAGIVEERPIINPEDPVELLECEPIMPMMYENEIVKTTKRKFKLKVTDSKPSDVKEETKLFIERNGWHCYRLDSNDTKLYQDAQILLEKLPQSFVDTYFQYQNITDKNEDDEEVERLINLQSLNRPIKDGKLKSTGKSKMDLSQDPPNQHMDKLVEDTSDCGTRPGSPVYSERYDELTPSDDEDGQVDAEFPAPVAKQHTSENNMAKNSLMDDNESEDESKEKKVKVKKEPTDSVSCDATPFNRCKPCPKSKKKLLAPVENESLMLTADKMMNKELTLLHAPVVLDETNPKIPVKGPLTRNKSKNIAKTSSDPKHVKSDDDSSSEEEKQWFTIKEKLLKRMINKKDTTREDDAKRAKLVSEFIERRGEQTENYLKRRSIRGRRSTKKMLERQKQLKVLSRELFGDFANDPSHQGKSRYSQNAKYKGRRNIRKVIDKKSLAKSTVVANMEEFERKRRLNIRQNKLRELLRCEEGVNVLVINDEVCLEYDFEKRQPIVTIHSFFTRVMKAHQYEGVKFMWDACFESLDSVESGNGGGGCILAHCMGLGKTLQVLALLHTVLTHPRVGMRRVLVCCPLSTVLNWVDEIHKWIGPVTDQIKVFELSKLKKTYERAYQLEDWYNGGGIFIIGYELFRSLTTLDPFLDDVRPTIINKIRTALLDPGPDIIICDEGHLLKNDCSVLAVAMSRVVTKRRIVLTGTPMQNNLREYYCMVNFIKPNLLGTYAEYSNRFENPIMNGQHRDSGEEDIKLMKARTHILHKVLEGCLQRQEASVLYPYLPKKHEYTVFIPLTKCQWDLYKHYMENYANSQNKSVLKDFHILQKIWSHPQVLHNFQTRSLECTKNKVKIEKLEDDLAREDLNADLNQSEDLKPSDREVWWLQYLEGGEMLDSLHTSNKFAAVFRILDECVALEDKLLIFSTSLYTMDALEYFLKKINNWSLGRDYYRLDGSVPAEVRQKWCREFNADNNHKTKLFLISTRAGCLGLNMTAANRVIILDTSWNPAHDIQSIFRVYRFGQKKDCYIYRLVAMGTMEQKIYERSVTKQAVACRVLDEQQIDRHYNMADLTELYKYDESGISVAGGVAVGVEDVVLLRVARDANLHAVHEHDSLLRGSGEQGLPEHERNAAWMQFQQEHAHKQMQNDLETQNEKSKSTIKLVHGHEYALSPTLKPVVKTEKEPLPTEPKSRRNKKNSIVSCCIPIQPETSAETQEALYPDIYKEEAMVKRISDILLEYNFHNEQNPRAVSDLVGNVRKIVESGRLETLSAADGLTRSIAEVLLQKDLSVPSVTDIVCESVNNTINVTSALKSKDETNSKSIDTSSTSKDNKPKRGRPRKGYVYEEIVPGPSNEKIEIKTDGRKKRRAALAAEKSFDAINNTVIDLDGDDSDTDFVPKDYRMSQTVTDMPTVKVESTEDNFSKKTTKTATLAETQKPVEVHSEEKKNTKNIVETIRVDDQEENSILLSDDDVPLKPKKPGPARKTMPAAQRKEKPKEKVEDKPEEKPEDVPKEIVPLHPSLLSNQNFIKIVAHTYLTGNPMLDEDAAMLAAQYSTQKAFKEYESTGNNIESGPLHDIALKVLGIDVLKKLNAVKPPVPVKLSPKPVSTNTPSTAAKIVKQKTPEPVKPVETKPIKLTIKIPSEGSMMKPIVTSSSVAHIPTPTSVIPVGMFMETENGQSSEECILPDDDDIRIINNPPPVVSPPMLARRNSKQLIVNNIISDTTQTRIKMDSANNASPSQPRTVIQPIMVSMKATSQNKAPIVKLNTSASKIEHILSDLNNTISLDSDEEEITPVSHAQTTPVYLKMAPGQPVPISLTKVNAVPQIQTTPSNTSNKIVVTAPEISQVANKKNVVVISSSKFTKLAKVVKPAIGNVSVQVNAQTSVSGGISQPVVNETILPNTSLPEPTLHGVVDGQCSKRICKAGDILRISHTGIIEVVSRKDRAVPKAATAAPTLQSGYKTPQNKQTPVNETGTTTAKSASKSNTSIIRSRSNSPFDPLSILKDVIHIEADDYSIQNPVNKITPTKKESPATNPAVVNSSASSSAKGTSVRTEVNSSVKPIEKQNVAGTFLDVLSHKNSKKTTITNKTKSTLDVSTDSNKKTSLLLPANKSDTNKREIPRQNKSTNEKVFTSVDLTEAVVMVNKQNLSAKTGRKPLIGSTLVGTSKDIIIDGIGKTLTKKVITPTPPSAKQPTSIAMKSTLPPVKTEKRPAPQNNYMAKKKKTDKPLTLKDFDIDDFDDIIELD